MIAQVKRRPPRAERSGCRAKRPVRSAEAKKTLEVKRAELFDRDIDYVPCRQFLRPSAEKLASTPPEAAKVPLERTDPQAVAAASQAPYVAQLYQTRLLSKEEEQYYFRRMNWLRFRAATARGRLDRRRATLRQIEQIQGWLREAEDVKSIIITSNLRLVVSIAKKFVDQGNSFEELVSEGNLALIRAVEKFNFALGNRFSTYATYAIQRIFFRASKKGWRQRQRFVTDDASLLRLEAAEPTHAGCTLEQVDLLRKTFEGFLESLEPREREIVVARFGFDGGPSRTFRELGRELGVCKERIRQIQARAMEKLRGMADEVRLGRIVDDWI